MEDLEQRFQQQCDDLLVSISSKLNTMPVTRNHDREDNVPEAIETLYDMGAISDNSPGGLNLDLEDCCNEDGQTWARNCPQITLNNFFHLNSMTLAGDAHGRVVTSPTPDITASANLHNSNKLMKAPIAERVMTPLENGKPTNFKLEIQAQALAKNKGPRILNEIAMVQTNDPISVTDYKALTMPTTQNNSFAIIPPASSQHNYIPLQIPTPALKGDPPL